MAGNTRGKLKEHFEGIHRNLDWSVDHVNKSLALIGEHKPELTDAITKLGEAFQTLDQLAGDVYSKL